MTYIIILTFSWLLIWGISFLLIFDKIKRKYRNFFASLIFILVITVLFLPSVFTSLLIFPIGGGWGLHIGKNIGGEIGEGIGFWLGLILLSSIIIVTTHVLGVAICFFIFKITKFPNKLWNKKELN